MVSIFGFIPLRIYFGAPHRLCLVLSVLTISSACVGEAVREEQIQVCLGSKSDLLEFIHIFNNIAEENGAVIVDRSEDTRKSFESINEVSRKPVELSRPVVNMSMKAPDGSGLSAYSLGMPGHQVVIAISGDNDYRRELLRNNAIQRISKRWKVFEVPSNKGAVPLENCS